jgi:hypothetical protein
MEQSKNNELRRYFMWSLLAAIGFSVIIAALSPALARFAKPLKIKAPRGITGSLPSPASGLEPAHGGSMPPTRPSFG